MHLDTLLPASPLQVLSDPKEWRNRFVNTTSHQQTLDALAPETNASLDRLAEELERTLAAVKKAEQKINAQCADVVAEHGDKQDEVCDCTRVILASCCIGVSGGDIGAPPHILSPLPAICGYEAPPGILPLASAQV
jgi:hypothetical protein